MKILITSVLLSSFLFANANIGTKASSFYIPSSKGGLAKGGAFSSNRFNGKVSVIM